MQWQISKNYEIVCVLGLSRGRVVRGYPSKNAGAGIPDLVPGPVLVPAKSARKESNAAFKFSEGLIHVPRKCHTPNSGPSMVPRSSWPTTG